MGSGKTGLIAVLPFGIARGRVLVIAPNLTIRDQLAAALDVASPDSFYRRAGVLKDVRHGPFRAVLDSEANLSDCLAAHIVITNIHQLAARVERWLPSFSEDFFDLIVIDEGHHNVAPTWQQVFSKFAHAKVCSVTATPFRADGQPIEGDTIYRYPIREAMRQGYIKHVSAVNVAPQEIAFTYRGDMYQHTLQEVLSLREEDWFSRGVALARESNASIVDASIQWLEHLRLTGTKHQLIAVGCSLDHAREIRGLYEERGLSAREIHSQQNSREREDILRELRSQRLDVLVQVQLLGEGFDHPLLSVAAIFRPFRSLSPYIQFIGRIMRVVVPNAPGHADNEGVVASHVGLNIDRHWQDFKYLDEEDRDVVTEWVQAGDARPTEEGAGERRKLRGDLEVLWERPDRFMADTYLEETDEAVIDNAIAVLREQGLDLETLGLGRAELARRIREAKKSNGPEAPIRLPVQPQAHRRVLRRRLAEQTRSAASRICVALGEAPGGKRIALLGGTGASNNLAAVIVFLTRKLNEFLGIEPGTRRDLTIEELERGIDALDDLADEVQRELRDRLSS
jgi:superfamily II DNA or RNA helicase